MRRNQRFEFNRKSAWNGKIIEMTNFKGTVNEYARELERFGGVLDGFTSRSWCKWMGVPETLALLHHEFVKLKTMGVRAGVAIGAPWVIDELRKCPASERFFEVYNE